MMERIIRLGQCWVVRLTKSEMAVRIEDYSQKGGWIARSLSHGRNVWIRKADQLLHRCDVNGLHIVADETEPNRRSPAPSPAFLIEEPECIIPTQMPPESEPLQTIPNPKLPEPVQPPTLLDATAIVLRENRQGMSTKEIIASVTEKGLWNPTGKTPWLTLHTALSREIETKGAASRFKKMQQRGKFTLR